jgi:hypothetical protein
LLLADADPLANIRLIEDPSRICLRYKGWRDPRVHYRTTEAFALHPRSPAGERDMTSMASQASSATAPTGASTRALLAPGSRRATGSRQACCAAWLGTYRADWRLRLEQRRSAGRRIVSAAAAQGINARGLSCLFVLTNRTVCPLSCLHPQTAARERQGSTYCCPRKS